MIDNIPPEVAHKLGGPFGGLIAMLFLQDPWPRRVAMAAAACPLSWYGAPMLVEWLPLMNEGLAGFLLGLFGMSIVSKIFDAWQGVSLVPTIQAWLDWLKPKGK
jgi:hypothetical protein